MIRLLYSLALLVLMQGTGLNSRVAAWLPGDHADRR